MLEKLQYNNQEFNDTLGWREKAGSEHIFVIVQN